MLREAVFGKLNALRHELEAEHPNPTAAENLLIERVMSTWLHLHHLELMYANEEFSEFRMATFQRALSAAQQRYLAALETLRAQRKVVLPPLQINVGEKQVNIAQNVMPPPPAPSLTTLLPGPAPLG
jgi:hypothetical protein